MANHIQDYAKIILLLSTNDCAAIHSDMNNLKANMITLTTSLLSVCPSVTVCSVLPRLDCIDINERSERLNAEISVMTTDLGCKYANIVDAFSVNAHLNY